MTECKSCTAPIPDEDRYKTLKDGTIYEEDFCGFCLETYVTNANSLPVKEYAFESITGRNDHYMNDFSDYDE